jgi:outer membrane receptor protein involved in Fe transport
MNNRTAASSSLALALLGAGPAHAGGLQGVTPTVLDPVAVTAATTGVETAPALAASSGVATAEQLENRPRLRTGELLEVVPGLIVTQHSGDGKANQYFLRGFNLDHGTDFRTTVAGMPVNLPSHGHGQGYTDLNFVIPELVERISYQKGSYDAAQGDFATAGAAELSLFSALPQGLAQVEVGEFNYQRLVAAQSFALAGGTTLLGVEASRQDGPWAVPENTGKLNIMARHSASLAGGSLAVTGLFYRNDWTATDQIPLRAVRSGALDRFGSLDDSTGGDTRRASLSLDFRRGNAEQAIEASAYFIDYRLNLFSNFTYFLDNPVEGDQFEQADDRRVAGGRLRFEQHGELFGRHIHHRAGAELRYDDIGRVGLYNTFRRQRLATVREDVVEQLAVGAFYDNTVRWTPWFRSVAGVRFDRYDFDVVSDNPVNSGRADEALASPKLSLIFGPWRHTELFLNAGAGFHSNDARGTTTTIDPASGEPVQPVDALVRARTAEIGLTTRLLPQLQTALTVWGLDLDSELLFIGDAGTTEATRPSRRRGIEFANYWTPIKGLILDADVALSRARFDDGDPEGVGTRIPGSIARTASVGLVLNDDATLTRGFFGGARLRYFGSRPLVEDNSVRSSVSTLVNLRGGYAFTPRLKLAVDVFNVFDREVSDIDYFYESRLRDEPAPVEDIHFHPAEPRSLRAAFIARF